MRGEPERLRKQLVRALTLLEVEADRHRHDLVDLVGDGVAFETGPHRFRRAHHRAAAQRRQPAFRADHWLHKYGDPLGTEAGPVRAAMRRQFYPETDDWKEAVLFRGHQIVRQAIAGVQKGAG